MSAPLTPRHAAVLRGALWGLLVLACCGKGPVVPEVPDIEKPCGLNDTTKFPDDDKVANRLALFTAPPNPNADELDAHCRAVWQEVILDRYCGDVAIPDFCSKQCGADESEKTRCFEGNGRGLVMQQCRVAMLPTFTEKQTACKDFTLCAGKLQPKTTKCAAGRM